MFRQLIAYGVRRLVGGPGRPWVFTSAAFGFFTFVRRQFGRRQMLDLSKTKPGDVIVIEHLHQTHAQQLKGERAVSRQERKANRKERKAARQRRREDRALAMDARRESRAARKVAREAKRNARAASRADRLQRRADKARGKVSE